MAVKQQVNELDHSQPNYDIKQLIDFLKDHAVPINDAHLIDYCKKIVDFLAHTPTGRLQEEIKSTKEQIAEINELLQKQLNCAPDIVRCCLTVLYEHITSDEKISCCASVVLTLVKKPRIKDTVHWILKCSHNEIRKIFTTLSNWLQTLDFAPDLTTWVLEILIGLYNLQKWNLLLELSQDIIVPFFKKLPMPIFQPKLGPVVLYILQTLRSDIFKLIIPVAPRILIELRKNERFPDLQTDIVQILRELATDCPESDQQYIELVEFLNKCPLSVAVCTNARVGLVNLGNTCYMNSVLQALVMTKAFCREILLSKIDDSLFFEIQSLLALLLHSQRPELTPRALLESARPPDFVPGYQQDSSEFLSYLLEKLHEQESKFFKRHYEEHVKANWCSINNKQFKEDTAKLQTADTFTIVNSTNNVQCPSTLIEKTFDGKLLVTYQCGQCDTKSTNPDAFRSFELSFPDPSNREADHSVQKLLDFYCSSEKLTGDNQYYCDKCKRLCDGERSIRITKSPRNLILTLKHFRYDQQRHIRAKLMNKVLHDENISIIEHNRESDPPTPVSYSLYAAVVHAGTSMDTGHYYTYAQDEPQCWYKFNDNFVSKCTVEELHALASPNTPYILFYQSNDSSCTSKQNINSQLPQLHELPPRLRGIVNDDNQSYKEKIRSETKRISHVDVTKIVLHKNYDSDNDEPPPNSCGSNSIDIGNRFIF